MHRSMTAGRIIRIKLTLVGATAFLVALAPAAALARNVYVTDNQAGGLVTIINDATNGVTGTVGVNANPQGIAITPDGSKAYTANSTANNVSVINTADNSTSTINSASFSFPYGVAVTPDGSNVYVTNFGNDSVSVINVASTAVSQIMLGSISADPFGLAISPDGSRLYVAEFGNDRLSIIDTSSNAVMGTVNTGGDGPDGVAITPDGSKLYVANTLDGRGSAITTSPLGVSVAVPPDPATSPKGVAITPDGSKAYFINSHIASSSVTQVDTANNTVAALIGGFNLPFFGGVRPAGDRLYVTNQNTVSVLDTANNSHVVAPPGIAGVPEAFGVAVTPDQAPTASFTSETAAACADTKFNGSASTDTDGTVASYGWDFGDSKTETTTTSSVNHAYAKGGTYTAKLTVTDNEGASTEKVFTGQTMSRNGSSSASKSQTVTIASAEKPSVVVKKPQKRKRYKRRTFRRISGTVSDPCGIDKVNYALALSRGGKCRYLGNTGKLGRKRRSCNKPLFRKAKLSGDKWSKTLGHRLPAGSYALSVKATNKADVTSKQKKVRFRLR